MALTGQGRGHELRSPAAPPAPRYQPAAPQPPPGRPRSGPSGRPGKPRRLPAVLLGAVTFLAAGGITAALMLVIHPLHRGPAPAPTSSAPAQPAQGQAARGLAGLLAQSVSDRRSIVAAVNDVSQCGPNLRQDPQTLQAAVASREDLLGRLASLPGRSALPPAMLASLTSAWQNSIRADQDYVRWAEDESARGCTANNAATDPNAQAAAGPDAQATAGKKTFVGDWNPVATRYGLSTYQWNQL